MKAAPTSGQENGNPHILPWMTVQSTPASSHATHVPRRTTAEPEAAKRRGAFTAICSWLKTVHNRIQLGAAHSIPIRICGGLVKAHPTNAGHPSVRPTNAESSLKAAIASRSSNATEIETKASAFEEEVRNCYGKYHAALATALDQVTPMAKRFEKNPFLHGIDVKDECIHDNIQAALLAMKYLEEIEMGGRKCITETGIELQKGDRSRNATTLDELKMSYISLTLPRMRSNFHDEICLIGKKVISELDHHHPDSAGHKRLSGIEKDMIRLYYNEQFVEMHYMLGRMLQDFASCVNDYHGPHLDRQYERMEAAYDSFVAAQDYPVAKKQPFNVKFTDIPGYDSFRSDCKRYRESAEELYKQALLKAHPHELRCSSGCLPEP